MAKKRILVLDDNEHVGWALKFLLQDDYIVDLVFNREEAIVQIKQHYIDLVLLDYHLDYNLTGDQVFAELGGIQPGIIAILLTANLDKVPKNVLLNKNIKQIVTKPFDIFELKSIIFKEINRVQIGY